MIREELIDDRIQFGELSRHREQNVLLCCKVKSNLSPKMLFHFQLLGCQIGLIGQGRTINPNA